MLPRGIRRPRANRPGRAIYLWTAALTLGLCGWLISIYHQSTNGAPISAATETGRWYGLAAGVLILVLALYGVRRRAHRNPVGPLSWWYRSHLLLGMVAMTLLACHGGFRLRTPFLTVLQISIWGALLSGAVGLTIQALMRNRLRQVEPYPALASELETRLSRTQRAHGAASESEGGAAPPPRAPDVDEETETRILLRSHRCMRGWTILHLVFAAAALQMTLWHIWLVSAYPR